MKKKLIISISAVLSLLIIGGGTFAVYTANRPQTAPVASVQPVKTPPTVPELLRLVNAERAKVGVAPLAIDERLNQSAQKKADDMYDNHYFGHVSPVDGRHGYEYAHDVMPECAEVSENIRDNDVRINTSQEVVSGWDSSAPHYKAMINSKAYRTGFGISHDQVVEHFCIAR